MKRCPKCNLNYSDNSLEFCLEDGSRLVPVIPPTETETFVRSTAPPDLATEKTVNLPFSAPAVGNLENKPESISKKPEPTLENKVIPITETNKILEIAPVVVSLAHNWWQWVYLNNQYYYSFGSYVLSANFLMWLLLLMAGGIIGLISLKKNQNKSFAITGLVILAINLLLFLVPKR